MWITPRLCPNSSGPSAPSLYLSFTPHDASKLSLLLAHHHRMVCRTQARARPSPCVVGTSHPTHHKPRHTSNPYDIANHSSSKDDHHWFSISPQVMTRIKLESNSSNLIDLCIEVKCLLINNHQLVYCIIRGPRQTYPTRFCVLEVMFTPRSCNLYVCIHITQVSSR